MANLTSLLERTAGPWTIGELATGFLLLAGGLILRAIVVTVVGRRLRIWAEKTRTEADDVAARAVVGPLGFIAVMAGVWLAFRVLAAPRPDLVSLGDEIFRVLMILAVGVALFRLADAASIGMMDLARRTESPLDDQIVPLMRKAAKVLVAIMAFVLVVQSLGYSVSGLLAGLGIGGLAFALAAKDTIANVFGSVTILIDKPFRTGDWVTTDDADGVVEEIGLRSTRIRTFGKTVVSIPNQQLANATVENHSLMPKRRVKMTVGVTYDTTPGRMRTLVERVEAMLRSRDDVHQEFMLVKFTDFGASSLDLFVYYFSVSTDWAEHLQVKQDVNLAIMDIVEELGLSIAFPTRTVHLVQGDSGDSGNSAG